MTASLMSIPSPRSLSCGAFQYFKGFIELLASVLIRHRWDTLSQALTAYELLADDCRTIVGFW